MKVSLTREVGRCELYGLHAFHFEIQTISDTKIRIPTPI
jgi:hypothetical protein